MPEKYNLSEVYPNSPLVEVVCEIRFSAELAIECRRNEFYDKIKKEYPAILIPQSGSNSVNALAPYRFENEDRTAGIMIAIDRFSFFDRDYGGHKRFITEFVRLAKILEETYPIKELKRLGWRYINIIPFSREDKIIPLHRFTSFELKLPEGISEKITNLSTVFISEVEEGTITTRIESIMRSDDQQEALLMDFDFALTERLFLTEIKKYVNKAHKQTREVFESLITDEYREYLRGETI
ncbi:MAG: hypothetical protein DRH37_05890 [Deltaproteobacteria bacterium]|nr:MAG: hypothetical protein DRH37_05890 [Deltaproteobacteria bacterium]